MDADSVDQQLLQQFSCLGTTDKDELIKQFQVLVGNSVSSLGASFFLDMNNWNLQAAVGSFFDFGMFTKLPSMTLVKDDSGNDILSVPPSTVVTKFWNLMNNGDEPWPEGCYLQYTGGDPMGDEHRILVSSSSLKPNQIVLVTAQLVSPNAPGVYKSKWRLATPSGTYFGDTIWVIMSVTIDAMDLAKQLSNLNTCSESSSTRSDMDCLVNPFGSLGFNKLPE